MPFPGLPVDLVTCIGRKPGTDRAGRTEQAIVTVITKCRDNRRGVPVVIGAAVVVQIGNSV